MDLSLTAAAPVLRSRPAQYYCLNDIIRAHSHADTVNMMLADLDRSRSAFASVLKWVSISEEKPFTAWSQRRWIALRAVAKVAKEDIEQNNKDRRR